MTRIESPVGHAKADPTKKNRSFALSSMGLTELWERFSFYGLQAILPFYLFFQVTDGGLEMHPAAAAGIVGAYGGAVYIAQLVGAWMGDRLLSPVRLVLWGGIIITIGHVFLGALQGIGGLSFGLILIILGTGALKTNITSIVGFILDNGPSNLRDSGFSYFYMAINIGAVVGPLSTGFAQSQWGFHWGFGLAAVGMAVAVIQFAFSVAKLPTEAKTVPNPLSRQGTITSISILAIVLAAGALVYFTGVVRAENLSVITTALAIVAAITYFIVIIRSKKITSYERQRTLSFIPFFIGASVFFGLLFQQFTAIALLISERVDHTIGGWEFPVAWITMTSQLAAVLVTPVLAKIWSVRDANQSNASQKFGSGLLQIGFAYTIMTLALIILGESMIPLALILFIMVVAGASEVFVGPIGLSLATKVGPAQFRAQFVALNFLTLALGSSISGLLGQLYTLVGNTTYFTILAICGLALGTIFLLFRKPFEQGLNSGFEAKTTHK
jgi:POT family proton-dependent oligopeptide transporter